ncbi:hypothetical protein RHOFW510R12_01015 [Rhodanobacter sp. FW510-R12]
MTMARTVVKELRPRPRTIVYWDRDGRDGELLNELDRFQARSRGARLKYLARLGLLVEARGAHLEGRRPDGQLVLPTHVAPPPSPGAGAPLSGAFPRVPAVPEDTGGAGLDELLASMEEV